MIMNNVTFVFDSNGAEHAIIDHGNEQFTSMPKAVYDEQQAQAEQSTPILPA
jgi:type I site-specific restriction endonuclease